jgi:hypothetical protein
VEVANVLNFNLHTSINEKATFMEQTDFQVILVLEGETFGHWPDGTPAPVVGDEINGSINNQLIRGKVVKREWGIAFEDKPPVQIAVLRIIVKSQREAPRAQATVQPLKL